MNVWIYPPVDKTKALSMVFVRESYVLGIKIAIN